MNGARAKKVLGYVLLPQVIPRARALFASGFGYIAFLMANIYRSVRLLPADHPYLNPANIGLYGVRHVIGEAANNLVLKKENADQIVVFIAMLAGIVILIAQFVLIIYAVFFQPALAASIFQTPNSVGTGGVTTDMAFIVLDRVFGVPELFCTAGGAQCTDVLAGGNRWPFHIAFHELLRFYSLGLLIVGLVIFLYYVLVVVGETATTGHPFGQRFQNGWVPIRLVVALGLLVPINFGLNSSQYVVLYAAKFGSGFATNGWRQFNQTLAGPRQNPLGEPNNMLAKPQNPSIMPVVQMMSTVHACAYAWWKLEPPATVPIGVGPFVLPASIPPPPPPSQAFYIQPYFVKQVQDWNTNTNAAVRVDGQSYVEALQFFNGSDIIIRFGYPDPSGREKGNIMPRCGDIRIPVGYLKTRGQGMDLGGPDAIQEFYYNMVLRMWFEPGLIRDLPQRYMAYAMNRAPDTKCTVGCGNPFLPPCGGAPGSGPYCGTHQVDASARQRLISDFQGILDAEITRAWNTYNLTTMDLRMTAEVLNRGWAGAGIWYNKIAEINGAFTSSVLSMPQFKSYPEVMEKVREERRKSDSDPSPTMQFNPNLKDGKAVRIDGGANSLEVAQKLNDFFLWWNKDDPEMKSADASTKGNPVMDVIKSIFGVNGLLAMRKENAHIHPMAQLSALGKSFVDSAIINIGGSVITAGLGGVLKILGDMDPGPLVQFISSMMMTIAFLGLTVGFILYYVLPFLPFLYFFFAFGTWVKSIFEAMVGAPLWALAHLRIDGEGLPGDSASSGYFLIFEIFLRPILTVFGLIASILIFSMQVRVLNVMWDLVVSNLTGFAEGAAHPGYEVKILPKNEIDEFFFTIVYAIIVYMMATASFKMIDKIPDQLLRFMGAGVSAFSDINADPTEGLTRYAAYGGITVGKELTGAVRGVAQGTSNALGGEIGRFAPRPPPGP